MDFYRSPSEKEERGAGSESGQRMPEQGALPYRVQLHLAAVHSFAAFFFFLNL